MLLKYYRVTCKCGHVGREFFVRIDFPVKAYSGKEAAEIARYIPRVKHNHKDAVLNCTEIDYEEYLILQKINKNDPYLCCKNHQEQMNIPGIDERLEPEPHYLKVVNKSKRNVVDYKNKKRRITERSFVSYQLDYESWYQLEESLTY